MSLKSKYKFRDLSLIRWVNDLSHFKDRFNSQNNQYFGHPENPYKLQIKNDDPTCFYDGIHRLVVTNYDIDKNIDFNGVNRLYFTNENEDYEIPSVINSDAENIYYITFLLERISKVGRLEIRCENDIQLIKNPSFENGIDNWNIEYGAFNSFTGYIETATQSRASQLVNLEAGKTYEISYSFEVFTNINRVTLDFFSGGVEEDISNSGTVTAPNDFATTFQFTPTKNYEKVAITVRSSGSLIWLYEFSIIEKTFDLCKISDCVKFVDEPLSVVHTRNYFDRKGIKWSYQPLYNWIRTTVPTKDLGLTDINPEREIQYLGSRNTPIAIESRDDETIKYEFLVDGHARFLDSIESLSGNIQGSDIQGGFYLDLIKLTPEGDMDRSDDSINGTMTYLLHKNDDGSNVFIDDEAIFDDLRPVITTLQPPDESIFTNGVDNDFPLTIFYNIDIQLNNDPSLEIRIYQDNVLLETLTYLDVIGVSDNILYVKASEIYSVGEYRIEVDDNFVLETTFGIYGANGLNDWNFKVNQPRIYNDNYSDVYS